MVRLLTSRVSYAGEDAINTTVKSGSGLGDCLAPTWPMVAGHKLYEAQETNNEAEMARWATNKVTGEPTVPLDGDKYTEAYLGLLRERYAENKQPFLDILNKEQAVLTCYCGPDAFCHRHIAAQVLGKIAERNNIPFERGGEIDPYTKQRWLPPDSPERQTIGFGIVPIVATEDNERALGYAAMAQVSNVKNLNCALELGYFRSSERAESYLEQVQQDLKYERLPLSGAKDDVQATENFLSQKAVENGRTGHWGLMTHQENKAWDAGTFSMERAPDQLEFKTDMQSIRFGTMPILAPNGMPLGIAAAALISQENNSHAFVEIAHFTLGAEQRADSYLNSIEDDFARRGVALEGSSKDVQRAVYSLTLEATGNRLSGEWTPLAPDDVQKLAAKDLAVRHSFDEVHTLSGTAFDVPLEAEMDR